MIERQDIESTEGDSIDSYLEQLEGGGSRAGQDEGPDTGIDQSELESIETFIHVPFPDGFKRPEGLECALAKYGDDNVLSLLVSETDHINKQDQVNSIIKSLIVKDNIKSKLRVTSKGIIRGVLSKSTNSSKKQKKEGEHGSYWLKLLKDSYKDGASDIHIEAREGGTRIRRRVFGSLVDYDHDDYSNGRSFIQFLYDVRAQDSSKAVNMNFRVPQNAAIVEEINGIPHKVRVATMPDANGIDMVLRLLEPQGKGEYIPFEKLGYTAKQCELLYEALKASQGLLIFTGVTGSGKSTTMANSARHYIKINPDKKVITAEDPVESVIEGATQCEISTDHMGNGAWEMVIRSMLRCDPDFAYIGEIRDNASAQMAIDAAMTGHPVITSLHASGIIGIYERFRELRINWDTLSNPSLFKVMVNQTLAPVLCDNCKIPLFKVLNDPELSSRYQDVLDRVEDVAIARELNSGNVCVKGNGCDHCSDKVPGVVGRTVLAEVVRPTIEMSLAIKNGDSDMAGKLLRDAYPEQSILDHAIEKVFAGQIDPLTAEEKTEYLTAALRHS